jgi:hypothetical protein
MVRRSAIPPFLIGGTGMSQSASNVVDRPAERMGTVDVLLGLVAAVTNELRSRGHEGKIPVGLLCNVLHQMQTDDRFSAELSHLDFDRIGESWFSRALEDFLFQAGTWDLHRKPNPSVATIALDEGRATRRLNAIEVEHGQAAKAKLQQMAQEFVSISQNLAPH